MSEIVVEGYLKVVKEALSFPLRAPFRSASVPQTRIQRALRRARFPFLKTIEEFNWTFQTSIDPKLLGSYLGPELVSEGRGLIFSGPTGTGKTSLSIAIAYRAIQNGFDALFTTANELIHDLSVASRDGRLAEALHPYTHTPVLVIDEVGYLVHPPDAANVLFQVVNERYLKHRPMIFTTNKPIEAWGQVLHDPDLAEAILDRALERGRIIQLRGASFRTRHLPRESAPLPKGDRTPLEGTLQGRPGPGERGKQPPPDRAIISGKTGQEYLEPAERFATVIRIWIPPAPRIPWSAVLRYSLKASISQGRFSR